MSWGSLSLGSLWLAVLPAQGGQQPAHERPALKQQALERQALRGLLPLLDLPPAARIQKLRAALAEPRPGRETALQRQRRKLLHFHLGRLELGRLAARGGRRELEAALRLSQPAERELRSRLLFGLAQADEMLGEPARALAWLGQLQREAADLPMGRLGRLADRRLRSLREGRLQVGAPAPLVAPRRIPGGGQRGLGPRSEGPSLLLFCRHDDPAGMRRVLAWVEAFVAAGGKRAQVLCFDLCEAPAAESPQLQRLGLPLLRSRLGCLDPVWLDYAVTAMPHAVLVGPDRRICAKDPQPAVLRQATRVLSSGR